MTKPDLSIAAALLLALALAAGTPGLRAETAEELRDTRAAFAAAIEAEDWPRAIELGKRIATATPAGGVSAYNLACVHALAGNRDSALAWFEKSAAEGLARPRLIARDPDLDSIRDDPRFAAAASRIAENRAREFDRFKAAFEAASLVVEPPDGYEAGKPAPLIIALHGFGSHAGDIGPAWTRAANEAGAILAVPNAVRRAGSGYSWDNEEETEWIVLRTIERAAAQYDVDRDRVVLTGFSQGGSFTLRVGLRNPETFCGLIPMAGAFDPDRVEIPDLPADRMPPVYLAVGGLDRQRKEMRQAQKALRAAGLKVELSVWSGIGHHFPPRSRFEQELTKALEFVCGL